MGETLEKIAERISSKKLWLAMTGNGILTFLYVRLDNSYAKYLEGIDLIREKSLLYDKFQWAFVAIVLGYITGDVIEKFRKSDAN